MNAEAPSDVARGLHDGLSGDDNPKMTHGGFVDIPSGDPSGSPRGLGKRVHSVRSNQGGFCGY